MARGTVSLHIGAGKERSRVVRRRKIVASNHLEINEYEKLTLVRLNTKLLEEANNVESGV